MALGLVGAMALVPLLGPGGPDPALSRAARSLVVTRGAATLEALDRLEAGLQRGLSAARSGAAAVVAGERGPGDDLARAAEELRSAAPAEDAAHAAVAALDGARLALRPDAAPVDIDFPPGSAASIAAQLEGTVAAADSFVAMRLRAEGLAGILDDAFVALEAGDLATAEDRVRAARDDLQAIEAWDVDFVTLPLWVETTAATVDATERIVRAARAGDADAARDAAEDFAGLRDEAAAADRALRIAIGEGATAVTAAPLERLAEVLRAVQATRLQVASIVQTVGR